MVILGCCALLSDVTPSFALSSRLTSHAIKITISSTSLQGALPSGNGITISVQVPYDSSHHRDTLVAIFDSPAFPQQLSPLLVDTDSSTLSTTLELGPLSGSIGSPAKAVPLHVTIARQRGMHVEELVRRTLYVTVTAPDTDRRAVRFSLDLAAGDDQASETTLLDGPIQEQDLLSEATAAPHQGYWKMVNRLIRNRLRLELPSHHQSRVQRGPAVRFQLFANGEAQLIEVERSSGDAELDHAAVLAVVNTHPFPPFPRGGSDDHIDVHVDLPAPRR
ncbi:MAG: cell envelope integrity protein TolA [Nitrospiraceae bacterium]